MSSSSTAGGGGAPSSAAWSGRRGGASGCRAFDPDAILSAPRSPVRPVAPLTPEPMPLPPMREPGGGAPSSAAWSGRRGGASGCRSERRTLGT
jgi:hypothetical protein